MLRSPLATNGIPVLVHRHHNRAIPLIAEKKQ
jgi:hypothetical protein